MEQGRASGPPHTIMASARKTRTTESISSDEVISGSDAQQGSAPAAVSGLRFLKAYGFQDEYGDVWFWHPGAVVRNPYVLGLLLGRAAPTEPME